MDQATRDSLVTGYEPLISALTLPDPDDRHVLAAAIVGRCDVIVTQSLKDFPDAVLADFQIEAQHPDEFLCNQLSLWPGGFCGAVRKVRGRLLKPPYSVEEYLAALGRQGLVKSYENRWTCFRREAYGSLSSSFVPSVETLIRSLTSEGCRARGR